MKNDYSIEKIKGKGFMLYVKGVPYILRPKKSEVVAFAKAHKKERSCCKLCEPKLELRFFNPFER